MNVFAPSVFKYAKDANDQSKLVQEFDADYTNRCRMIQAEAAFIWFMFGCFLVTLALSFTNKTTKRGGAIV